MHNFNVYLLKWIVLYKVSMEHTEGELNPGFMFILDSCIWVGRFGNGCLFLIFVVTWEGCTEIWCCKVKFPLSQEM